MATSKIGAIDTAKNVKAGCGIRYDPEQLGEDSGFDFSAARDLISSEDSATDQTTESPAESSPTANKAAIQKTS